MGSFTVLFRGIGMCIALRYISVDCSSIECSSSPTDNVNCVASRQTRWCGATGFPIGCKYTVFCHPPCVQFTIAATCRQVGDRAAWSPVVEFCVLQSTTSIAESRPPKQTTKSTTIHTSPNNTVATTIHIVPRPTSPPVLRSASITVYVVPIAVSIFVVIVVVIIVTIIMYRIRKGRRTEMFDVEGTTERLRRNSASHSCDNVQCDSLKSSVECLSHGGPFVHLNHYGLEPHQRSETNGSVHTTHSYEISARPWKGESVEYFK